MVVFEGDGNGLVGFVVGGWARHLQLQAREMRAKRQRNDDEEKLLTQCAMAMHSRAWPHSRARNMQMAILLPSDSEQTHAPVVAHVFASRALYRKSFSYLLYVPVVNISATTQTCAKYVNTNIVLSFPRVYRNAHVPRVSAFHQHWPDPARRSTRFSNSCSLSLPGCGKCSAGSSHI